MNIKDLTPVGEMILVRDIEEDHVRASGLILTTDINRYSQEAEVVAVGSGEVNKSSGKRIPNDLSVGETVYYTAYAGVASWREGEENYTLLKERDVIAKVIS